MAVAAFVLALAVNRFADQVEGMSNNIEALRIQNARMEEHQIAQARSQQRTENLAENNAKTGREHDRRISRLEIIAESYSRYIAKMESGR